MKKILITVLFIALIAGSALAYSNFKENKELTSNQIDKMIELGIIRVYVNLPENSNDKNVELTYETKNGNCNIYQDILGRYYCRW